MVMNDSKNHDVQNLKAPSHIYCRGVLHKYSVSYANNLFFGFILKSMNTLPLEHCRFNSPNCSWVAAAATEKLECKNHKIRAIVSQKLQNKRTLVAKITIYAHPNFVHYWGFLYIIEKICTLHYLAQTGIGTLGMFWPQKVMRPEQFFSFHFQGTYSCLSLIV